MKFIQFLHNTSGNSTRKRIRAVVNAFYNVTSRHFGTDKWSRQTLYRENAAVMPRNAKQKNVTASRSLTQHGFWFKKQPAFLYTWNTCVYHNCQNWLSILLGKCVCFICLMMCNHYLHSLLKTYKCLQKHQRWLYFTLPFKKIYWSYFSFFYI